MIICLVLAGYLPAVAQEDDESQAGNPNVYGIAAHAWWLDPEVHGDQLLDALDDLGVTTVRIGIDWKRFEPEQGEFDWAMYDRVFGELARRNIEIVANFNTIPAWASERPELCGIEEQEIHHCELRDDMYPEYERAVEEAVSRYSWISNWEFWNEPEMWRHLGNLTYLEHLRTFYDITKEINPEIQVASSTLAGPEYIEWLYNVSEDWYGEENAPWDAVAYHPYSEHNAGAASADDVDPIYIDGLLELHELMVAHGHPDGRIWVTEYGWFGEPEDQGEVLVDALDWLKEQPFIEFAHLHMLHDWDEDESHEDRGLMAIIPDESGETVLDEDTEFTPKRPFYDAFKEYPRAGLADPPERQGARYFPETGHLVEGRFLRFWEQNGGLRTIGLPLTRPYLREQEDGSWLLVQDFERMRLEYHPAQQGTGHEVQGTLVGRAATAGREDEAAFQPLDQCTPDDERRCFDATGHSLAYGFRDFWREHGGLARFGYPISEEFTERNPDTGEMHTVQYFERARFEYHPDLAGTSFEVQLGLLVRDDLEDEGLIPPDELRDPTHRRYE